MTEQDDEYVYDETIGEWRPASEMAAQKAGPDVVDSTGAVLADGDSVTLIKDLKVKGTNQTLKRGTVIKSIRLTDDPEHVDCTNIKARALVKTNRKADAQAAIEGARRLTKIFVSKSSGSESSKKPWV